MTREALNKVIETTGGKAGAVMPASVTARRNICPAVACETVNSGSSPSQPSSSAARLESGTSRESLFFVSGRCRCRS